MARTNPKKLLERLRSTESASNIAADTGLKDGEVASAREICRHIGEHQASAAARLPDLLAQAVVEAGLQIEHGDFLRALAESESKGASGAARRALAILKSRGIEVEVEKKGEPVFKPATAAADELPCLITTPDPRGERAIWIPRHQRGGGVGVTIVLVSDTRGIVHVEDGELPRKAFRKLKDDLIGKDKAVGAIEIPLAKAKGYVAAARTLSPAGVHLHEARLLAGIDGEPGVAVPDSAFAAPLPGELESQRVLEGAQLHDEKELKPWMADEQVVRALALRLDEVMTSALYVDTTQRLQQFERELARATEEWFTDERKKLYAQRLFAMADYFAQNGRKEAAERSAATARALASDKNVHFIPFCGRMFDKLFPKPTQPEGAAPPPKQEQESPTGLIIPGR